MSPENKSPFLSDNNQSSGSSVPPATPLEATSVPASSQPVPASSPIAPSNNNVFSNPVFVPPKSPFTAPVNNPATNPVLPKKTKKISVWVILATLVIISILMIIFLVFVLSMGTPASNPVLKTFSIDPFALKITLIQITSFAFGGITFILFLLLTFGIFRGLMTKKDEKEKKKTSFILAIFSFSMMFLTIMAWLGVYYYIEAFVVSAKMPEAEIVIKESANEILQMASPIELTLSAEQAKKVADYNNRKIVSFEWDLDNNGTFESPTQKIEFMQRFNLSGQITIRLKVNYENKENQIIEKIVNLPQAIFDYKPKTGPAPLTVVFDASKFNTADYKIAKYEWNFDEDNESNEVTDKAVISHIFTKIGTYNVKLKTESITGSLENYQAEIKVEAGSEEIEQFKAIINSEKEKMELIAPIKLRFSAKDSIIPDDYIVSYKWDFGDGSLPVETIVTDHNFEKAGEYNITLTLTEKTGKISEAMDKIVITNAKSAPEAIIKSFPKELNGTVPFSVEFDGSLSADADNNIVEYSWDFNNDEIIDSKNAKTNYVFREAGTYIVTLTVIDADNQKNKVTVTVTVVKNDIQAIIKANPQSGPIPLNVSFDGSTSSYANGKIVSYEWDFGDKSKPILGGAFNTHRYDKVGEYKTTLKIFADDGATSTTSVQVYARAMPIQACYTVSRHSGAAPLNVSFDSSCSSGNIVSWKWNFGDNLISRDRKPTHTFNEARDYEVTLEIIDTANNVSVFKDNITAQ